MIKRLARLPIDLAGTAVTQAARVADSALDVIGELVPVKIPGRGGRRATAGSPDVSPRPRPSRPADTAADATAGDAAPAVSDPAPVDPLPPVERPPAVDYDAPPVLEPRHIATEEELVAERADPGARDGAGAELRIDEPWPGYTALNAADVIDRIGQASEAELAMIELYERGHRARQTVLSAVEQRLKAVGGPGRS